MTLKETRTINDHEVILYFNTERQVYFVAADAMEVFLDCVQKVKQYEDAEEQGLLLRLPCKVGDDVYYILGIPNETPCVIESCVFELSDIRKIGKTLFLTREEAEAELKKMQEGE